MGMLTELFVNQTTPSIHRYGQFLPCDLSLPLWATCGLLLRPCGGRQSSAAVSRRYHGPWRLDAPPCRPPPWRITLVFLVLDEISFTASWRAGAMRLRRTAHNIGRGGWEVPCGLMSPSVHSQPALLLVLLAKAGRYSQILRAKMRRRAGCWRQTASRRFADAEHRPSATPAPMKQLNWRNAMTALTGIQRQKTPAGRNSVRRSYRGSPLSDLQRRQHHHGDDRRTAKRRSAVPAWAPTSTPKSCALSRLGGRHRLDLARVRWHQRSTLPFRAASIAQKDCVYYHHPAIQDGEQVYPLAVACGKYLKKRFDLTDLPASMAS